MSILGTRVVRTEDPRLLTVGGVYCDDLDEPALAGALHATYVRSPLAHGRISAIDVEEARRSPGVVAVFTAADLDLPALPPAGSLGDAAAPAMVRPFLAGDVVRFAGEPVAVILTERREQGEDAAELVSVDYEPLPAVVDVDDALRDETVLFPEVGTNVHGAVEPDGGFDDAAFNDCEVVVSRRIENARVAPAPLEVRSAACMWAEDGRLVVWLSTQNAQSARDTFQEQLGLSEGQVRVITPDVGGGFGAKIVTPPEAVLLGWLSARVGRPLRWTETRSENLMSMSHGRAQRQLVTIGGRRDGTILTYRLEVLQDAGAYPSLGATLPGLTLLMASGPYDIPKVEASARSVVTNTMSTSAYRGAGRPEATAAIERAIDLFAAEIGLDPADVRRRNFVAPDKFPYSTAGGAVYDSGEYAKALDAVLEAADYRGLRNEQARRRQAESPIQLGLGLSSYVEITAPDNKAGEYAEVKVLPDGSATVFTGSSPHGQGHGTSFAMLVSDQLGLPLDKITVVHGDTDQVPNGIGTMGSRSLQLGGSAVRRAAVEVVDKGRQLAAELMEIGEQDLVLDTEVGRWQVRGDPSSAIDWAELAQRAGDDDALGANAFFASDEPTFPFGTHLAVVEVDVETGKVRLVRFVSVDDAGRVLNPVTTEGQRHGGIAQGAAQALFEQMTYDDDGNPVTANFADYAFPSAAELPSFDLLDMQTETPLNPLGAKGIGEAGTIGATPAVQNAVVDALAHLGVRHVDMPTTPQRVWMATNSSDLV